MNDPTALSIDVKAESARDDRIDGNLLGIVVLGLGGAATVGWLAFLGWGMMSLIGRLIG